ncbi:MAG: CARDB domain-containing protein [Halodesulfurarchaeum sp.]
MKRQLLSVALLLAVGISLVTAPVAAAEDPRIETYVPRETVSPGQTTQFTVNLLNDAEEVDDRVKPARNVKATVLDGRTPFSVPTGTRLLGALRNEQPVPLQFPLTVPRNIDPGTYRLPIRLTYEYDFDERETTIIYATVRIEDRASFTLVDVESALEAGESGSLAVTLRNDGTETASDATVTLQSRTSHIAFGTSASTTAFVGSVAPNETVTVTADASVPSGADVGTYPVSVSVAYENADGLERRSFPMTAGVPIGPESDRFAVSNVTHSLRVGEEGSTSLTLTNVGTRITDAVVTLGQTGSNIHPLSREYAVGTLEGGQSVTVTFPIEVSGSAESTPRQFAFVVSYETPGGEDRRTTLTRRVPIKPEREQFLVSVVNASVPVGGTGTVTVEVTNNGDRTVTDVNAKLFANDPISARDDVAYVRSLAPGETTEMAFGVGVAGTARTKPYPLSLDFQYDVNGDGKLSKVYQIPVTVKRSESGPSQALILGGIVAVLAALAIGYRLYRRR